MAGDELREQAYLRFAAILAQIGTGWDDLFTWNRCSDCPTLEPCPCSGVPYPSADLRRLIDQMLWLGRYGDGCG